MEKDRQTKIIAIVALVIGVATLTLGFAAFSAKLIIRPKATVTPNGDSFKVVLSKEQYSEVVGAVIPSGDGEEATISNSGTSTISGLKANFVNPGEKVVYEFYASNIGELDAYLNRIDYANITDSTTNKVCMAGEGVTSSLVESACESIRVTVQVGEEERACQTSTYGAHKLGKQSGEKVIVTIEYDKNGVVSDVPFNVEFGDITISYSETDAETKNISSCTDYNANIIGLYDATRKSNVVDNDSNGLISLGDKVILGTEAFYVMSTDETAGTVTMLAEWNLNVGNNTVEGTAGMQNEACKGSINSGLDGLYNCTMAFSETNYWGSNTGVIYDSNSNLYPHVENYVSELKKFGYINVEGRLINNIDLLNIGCSHEGQSCSSAPSWVLNTSYWGANSPGSTLVWRVNVNGTLKPIEYTKNNFGVRPVITISAAEIK